ncbi:hypothetical protein [Mesorhizobium sp. M0254]|uniref:hypothetical protein n=1 Tax=Mesorhizobium sp. M0254 TaxID=2956927 RepID=UPI0033364E96
MKNKRTEAACPFNPATRQLHLLIASNYAHARSNRYRKRNRRFKKHRLMAKKNQAEKALAGRGNSQRAGTLFCQRYELTRELLN